MEKQISPCADGTVETYAGSSCSQPNIVYHFPPLAGFFESLGAVEIEPADVTLEMDRNGPNTILIKSDKFNLNQPDQDFDVLLEFLVEHSNAAAGFLNEPQVSGRGSLHASITVEGPQPVRAISSHDVHDVYVSYPAGDYRIKVRLRGESHDGTARFKSYGVHFGVIS